VIHSKQVVSNPTKTFEQRFCIEVLDIILTAGCAMAKQNTSFRKIQAYSDGSYSKVSGGACGIYINVENDNIFEYVKEIPYATDSMIAEIAGLNECLKRIQAITRRHRRYSFFILVYIDCESVYNDLLRVNKRIIVKKRSSQRTYQDLRCDIKRRCAIIRSFGHILKIELITGNKKRQHYGHRRADLLSKSFLS
jgi:hypothetical protein